MLNHFGVYSNKADVVDLKINVCESGLSSEISVPIKMMTTCHVFNVLLCIYES